MKDNLVTDSCHFVTSRDIGVERVVLLVRRIGKCLEPCCAARHPAAHDIIAAAHCIINAWPLSNKV